VKKTRKGANEDMRSLLKVLFSLALFLGFSTHTATAEITDSTSALAG
jgi:hypothetical protein